MSTAEQTDYLMPSLGADMDEGSVIEWNVAVGDRVARGDVVARVETEKSDIDIEIWRDGEVQEILVPLGRVVPVGTPLLRLGSSASADATVATPKRSSGAMATPLARRMASERGVDLTTLSGSGPHGAVRSRDLPTTDKPPRTDEPQTDRERDDSGRGTRADRMRSAIADRMSRANRDIPHYFLERQIDLSALLAHLGTVNAEVDIGDRVVPAAAFVRATALAAARHSEMNGHWIDGAFVPGAAVNVAVAISLRGGGLVTPQIPRADTVDLTATMARLKAMTLEARSGVLRSASMGAGSPDTDRPDTDRPAADAASQMSTITVTNLGERGADLVYGVISPPEVALVGFGRVAERPWVVDGHVQPCHMVTATLAADHRASDGAAGSRFLATLARLLENPEEL